MPLAAVLFEQGVYLVSREQCEALQTQMVTAEEGVERPEAEVGADVVIPTTVEGEVGIPTPEISGVAPTEQRFKHVRLIVADIPASKIADVNRGILMPISRAVGEFEFTLEIDASSAGGISQTALENQIKETIRQIGATLRDETLEQEES